jgi:hypothetical protein
MVNMVRSEGSGDFFLDDSMRICSFGDGNMATSSLVVPCTKPTKISREV